MSMEHSCKNEVYTCQRCGKQIPLGQGCSCLDKEIQAKMKMSKKEQK
nr:MAG TPA: ubiquitin-binding zinc finger protein [Caudoviricetes sp.]